MLLVLVRHASAEGASDPRLTRYGRSQAEALGPVLAKLAPFDQVFSSPMVRAVETARLAVGGDVDVAVIAHAAPDTGSALLRHILPTSGRVLAVTHEDVIKAVVRDLTGKARAGYDRASVTTLRRSTSGWTSTTSPGSELEP